MGMKEIAYVFNYKTVGKTVSFGYFPKGENHELIIFYYVLLNCLWGWVSVYLIAVFGEITMLVLA
jgi:hypothetical protein